ncbi:MAG: lipolytic enzyme family [Marmoricola sp.]|nr:lipolytic enzyme family [Marmoricola sp.]
MRQLFRRAGLPVLAAVLAATAAGCGGFGSVQPLTVDTALHSYVALGDGFAAGPYAGRTAGGCLRGADNYPTLVARELKITTFTDVTCTGADTRSLTEPGTVGTNRARLPAQIAAVGHDTALVTVTAGIMDHDLLDEMFRVCLALPCGNAVLPNDLSAQLTAFENNLTAALRAIQDKAPQAFVVVVGYPQLMPLDKTCAKLPRMTLAQFNASNTVLSKLNVTVESAAHQTGSTFVDLSGLTQDHSACSAAPWVSGMTAVAGHSIAYHPLPAEQAAVATAVASAVRTR